MKAVVIAVLCVAIGLGIILFRQNAIILAQEAQLAAIGVELSGLKQQTNSASLDLQVKCSELARKAYVQDGYGDNKTASHRSHYNAHLNRCFISIHSQDKWGAGFHNRNVLDAVEGKVYGAYLWKSDAVKKYWEVPPLMCWVESPKGEKQECHSDEEFSKLIEIYMAG